MEAYFAFLSFLNDFISIYQKEKEIIVIGPDDLETTGYFIATYLKIGGKTLFYAVIIKAKRSTLAELTLLYDPAKTIEVDKIIGYSFSNEGLCLSFIDFKRSIPKTIGIEEKVEKIKHYMTQWIHDNNRFRERLMVDLLFGTQKGGECGLPGGLPSLGKKR